MTFPQSGYVVMLNATGDCNTDTGLPMALRRPSGADRLMLQQCNVSLG